MRSLLPIFLLILLGWALKRSRFLDERFWVDLERFSYYVLFPILIVTNLLDSPVSFSEMAPAIGGIYLAMTVVVAVLFAGRPWLLPDGPTFTSVCQGALRFNSYVALAVAQSMLPSMGVSIGALIMGALIPPLNVGFVILLARFGQTPLAAGRTLVAILKNPLVASSLAGIVLRAAGVKVPFPISGLCEHLNRTTLPLGLLAVGAGLQFRLVYHRFFPLSAAVLLRLLALPLLAGSFCHLFGATPEATVTSVIFCAVPTAASSYILARQMGGDAPLMAAIISLQTLCAAATLPVILGVVG